ncbi:unnamed protein product [Linum tenue]|uniref:Uncharacterized protein n=1 Tax=Linum tenue TaxID=586396 RepID=A0AAV0KJK5_9ROSI|nr:unnamed protein product [Linum tenue]
MLLTSQQHLFVNSPPQTATFCSNTSAANSLNLSVKLPNHRPPLSSRCHLVGYKTPPPPWNLNVRVRNFSPFAYGSDGAITAPSSADGGVTLDACLAIAEFLCIFSSAIVTVSYAVNCTVLSGRRTVLGVIGSNGAFAWGVLLMLSGVVIGGWIRRRQWRRICKESVREGRDSVNLLERIEKLEEDLRSSATIVRVLSRQLEKLGNRFRLTRKALKEPIAETAALAQRNSEATRALAMQEDNLEKELGEVQKVLLAMQEQQEKQLELILAISKVGKLLETKPERRPQQDVVKTSQLSEGVKQLDAHEPLVSGARKGTNSDTS